MCQASEAERNFILAGERYERHKSYRQNGERDFTRGVPLTAHPWVGMYMGPWEKDLLYYWERGWWDASKALQDSQEPVGDVPLAKVSR